MKKFMRERGQSLVEFAVSLVILLYLLSGAAEFGVLFFQFVQLRDAAQEGALFGSMRNSAWGPIEERARAASDRPINLSDTTKVHVSVYVDSTLVWKDGIDQGASILACEGKGIRVTVEYNHQIFMPFMARLLGRTPPNSYIPLSATVVDTILTPPLSTITMTQQYWASS